MGMPVMICSNFDIPNGVVNGCTGTLKEVQYTTNNDGNCHAHACVVSLPGCDGKSLCNLTIGQMPILEDTCAMTFTNPHSHKRCSIKRTQLPIVLAFALTAHKSQGKTLPAAILDIQSCWGTESVYVMLSQVTSIEWLQILRPFNIKKIQCCPSKDSRREAQHLSVLDINSVDPGETLSNGSSSGDILDSRLYAAPERLEDPEELNAIQMAVSSLELGNFDGVEFQSNKCAHDSNAGGRLLKKQRLNMW